MHHLPCLCSFLSSETLTFFLCRVLLVSRRATSLPSRAETMPSAEQQQRWWRKQSCWARCLTWNIRSSSSRRTRSISRRTRSIYRRVSMRWPTASRSHSSPLQEQAACMCAHKCVYACACVRACIRVCMRMHVHACRHVHVREGVCAPARKDFLAASNLILLEKVHGPCASPSPRAMQSICFL